jgi:hypothetical protein
MERKGGMIKMTDIASIGEGTGLPRFETVRPVASYIFYLIWLLMP